MLVAPSNVTPSAWKGCCRPSAGEALPAATCRKPGWPPPAAESQQTAASPLQGKNIKSSQDEFFVRTHAAAGRAGPSGRASPWPTPATWSPRLSRTSRYGSGRDRAGAPRPAQARRAHATHPPRRGGRGRRIGPRSATLRQAARPPEAKAGESQRWLVSVCRRFLRRPSRDRPEIQDTLAVAAASGQLRPQLRGRPAAGLSRSPSLGGKRRAAAPDLSGSSGGRSKRGTSWDVQRRHRAERVQLVGLRA